METKQFVFGGLKNVIMYKHPEAGWGTTPQIFCEAVNTSLRNFQLLLKRFELIAQGLAKLDGDFAKNISRNRGRGRRSEVFLTTKGLIFLAQLLHTPESLAFKKEVLETIEGVADLGFIDAMDLLTRIQRLEQSDVEKTRMMAQLIAQNEKLIAIVAELSHKLQIYDASEQMLASSAGKLMARARATKPLRLMQ